jgi:hypothetical protein
MGDVNRYIDWVPILDDIENKNEKTILELGCGMGTAYLVDNFKSVYSFETNSRDIDGKWFSMTQEQHKDKPNWKGMFSTNYPAKKGHISNLDELFIELDSFVNLNDIDVVFVDPGFFERALCVNYFADKGINEIFTHDVNYQGNLYGWKLLENITDRYKIKAQIKKGQGTILYEKI